MKTYLKFQSWALLFKIKKIMLGIFLLVKFIFRVLGLILLTNAN